MEGEDHDSSMQVADLHDSDHDSVEKLLEMEGEDNDPLMHVADV